jgi:transcriptional regulator with XRE-family HTH domain
MLAALVRYYGADLTGRFEPFVPIVVDPEPVVDRSGAVQRLSAGDDAGIPAVEGSELAVETLLADLALARLGTVLRSTREEISTSRRDVASRVGTTARELRRYETGVTPVPRGILTALAEFYGDDLDTHFAHRNPVRVDPSRRAGGVEEAQAHSGDGDEALGAYVGILRRPLGLACDEPLTLHADDMAALSTALAVEPEHVKGRIVELLARTTRLRHHHNVRRRKRILSGAGVGIVVATLAGFGTGAFVSALPGHADPLAAPVAPTSATAAEPSTTTEEPSTTFLLLPTTGAVSPTSLAAPPAVVETTTVPTTEPPTATGVAIGSPITAILPPTTTTVPRPQISTDTTPISIPGTEPVTVITEP